MVINQRVITNILPHIQNGSWVLFLGVTVAKPNSVILDEARAQVSSGLAVTRLVSKQVLCRLAVDPRDGEALMVLYEDHEGEIRTAAIRWFENNRDRYEQAIHNILVAIGRNAGSYDPQSMDAAEWVRQSADDEARKLRERLDMVDDKGRDARGNS